MTLETGQRVLVNGVLGTVRYLGDTDFSPGHWVGVELETPTGKNDGSVQGTRYFACPDKHGMFVRAAKVTHEPSLVLLQSKLSKSDLLAPGNATFKKVSGSSKPAQSSLAPKTQLSGTDVFPQPKVGHNEGRQATNPARQLPKTVSDGLTSTIDASSVVPVTKTVIQNDATASKEDGAVAEHKSLLKRHEDLRSRIKYLEAQREDDVRRLSLLASLENEKHAWVTIRDKLREKLQSQQLEIKALQQKLSSAEHALKSDTKHDTDMTELLEMATLDREMAEEERDHLRSEVVVLKNDMEALFLEIAILREEGASSKVPGSDVPLQYERMKEALVRLKEITLEQDIQLRDANAEAEASKATESGLRKEIDAIAVRLRDLEAINEDLRTQVNISLGAEEMLESLTDRNLFLGEEVERCRAIISDLEALKEVNDELEEARIQTEGELLAELDSRENKIKTISDSLRDKEDVIVKYAASIRQYRARTQELEAQLLEANNANSEAEAYTVKMKGELKSMAAEYHEIRFDRQEHQVSLLKSKLMQASLQRAYLYLEILHSYSPEAYKLELQYIKACKAWHDVSETAKILSIYVEDFVKQDSAYTSIFLYLNSVGNLGHTLQLILETVTLSDVAQYAPTAKGGHALSIDIDSLSREFLHGSTRHGNALKMVQKLNFSASSSLAKLLNDKQEVCASAIEPAVQFLCSCLRSARGYTLVNDEIIQSFRDLDKFSSTILVELSEVESTKLLPSRLLASVMNSNQVLLERLVVLDPGTQSEATRLDTLGGIKDNLTACRECITNCHESGKHGLPLWLQRAQEGYDQLTKEEETSSNLERCTAEIQALSTQLRSYQRELDEERVKVQVLNKRNSEHSQYELRLIELERAVTSANVEKEIYEDAIDDLNGQLRALQLSTSSVRMGGKRDLSETSASHEVDFLRDTVRKLVKSQFAIKINQFSNSNDFLSERLLPDEGPVLECVSTCSSIGQFFRSANLINFVQRPPATMRWQRRRDQWSWIHFEQEREYSRLTMV